MIQIEDGHPVPDPATTGVPRYPWPGMKVGDSFFAAVGPRNNLSEAIVKARRKYGHKYTRRRVTENGVPGVRVWRVA